MDVDAGGRPKKYVFATRGENTDYSSRRQRAPIYIQAAPGSAPPKNPWRSSDLLGAPIDGRSVTERRPLDGL